MKKNKKEVEIKFIEVVVVLFIIIFLYSYITPSYTGSIVHSSTPEIPFSDLIYDDSLIEVVNNQVSLKLQELTSAYLVYNYTDFNIQIAERGCMNITSYLISLDGSSRTLDSNQEIRIEASQNLQNSDVISFYLIRERASNVSICSDPENCEIIYGTFYYPSASDGYYNVTISNLINQTNEFYILTDAKIKIDYLKFYRTTSEEITETNYTYENASIETNDINLDQSSISGIFSTRENLNSQQILYYYSLDSGAYNLIEQNTIPLNNASAIKFKSELITDGTATPVLSSISFSYDYDAPCIENWEAYYGECLSANEKLKYYEDSNSCGTFDNFPLDSSTYVYCEYIIFSKFVSNIDFASSNLSNIENLNLEIENLASISFSEPVSIERSLDLNSNIIISNNSITLDSGALPELNKSAVLTLKNLTFNNPVIYRDGELCNDCNKLSYNNGAIIFEVPHFTAYSIEEGEYCGDSSCNNNEDCSSCSSDCGACQASSGSSSSGSGGKSSFTRPSGNTNEASAPIVSNPVNEPAVVEETREESVETVPIEKPESSSLEAFTGQAVSEFETASLKKRINVTLIAVIVFNVLFIVYKLKFRNKKKPFPFIEDLSKFGIKEK